MDGISTTECFIRLKKEQWPAQNFEDEASAVLNGWLCDVVSTIATLELSFM